MSDWREIAYEADRDSGIEYGGEDFDTEIRRLRARIRELEERLQNRDMLWENAIRQTGYDIPPHSQKEFIDACRKRVSQENS